MKNERGAALLLSIVVVLVLTTLALSMATFAGAEERTANTWKEAMEARAAAEAGVRIAQEMFRDRRLVPPLIGSTEAEIEARLNAIGVWRATRPGATPARYSGGGNVLLQPPFRDSWAQVFAGSSNAPDLRFNCSGVASCWLDTNVNAFLAADGARVTDISFYAPPVAKSVAYGIASVRVTAEKTRRGELLARETVEAVIVDLNERPAVLGNGDVVFRMEASGDGCARIHANGDAATGIAAGGSDPIVTATGSINGASTSVEPHHRVVAAPRIDPWDLAYKPVAAVELSKYYRATPGPDTPRLYRWNASANGWTECASGTALICDSGGPELLAGDGFTLVEPMDGATLLVDGAFRAAGGGNMTVIATGSIEVLGGAWTPALSNRALFISGGDVKIDATANGIIAAHGRIEAAGTFTGVLVSENAANAPLAIHAESGTYVCDGTPWPWAIPVRPGVVALKAATK